MSRTNETRHIKWHQWCKCQRRLHASVYNNKECRDDDKCKCKCKELIDKRVCDKGFIWNPSNCECKFAKSYNVGEYLDYENCNSKKKLVNKLVEERAETEDEVKITSENKNKFSSFILYIVLFSVIVTVSIGIGIHFSYFHWYLKKDFTPAKTTIWRTYN